MRAVAGDAGSPPVDELFLKAANSEAGSMVRTGGAISSVISEVSFIGDIASIEAPGCPFTRF
ncbi:hypothetical protein BHE75_02616 [Sphingomonas haloaromaticamans]|uniref:Uncharacterized protein n=1 Tax=Edaphosphingomonas haloaromaticamans TaxID=653954 RepID=A0A1S1HES4_9SPHN|nr:hypothetical protein BHE75_02616 [Sphingomonas haloaromaticamans]